MGRRVIVASWIFLWLVAGVSAGGQGELQIVIPPSFIEERGDEWSEEFRAELLQALAAVPVGGDAVRFVLQYVFVGDLPLDPREAAGRLSVAIEFADAGLRRGLSPSAVLASVKQHFESGARGIDVKLAASAARSLADGPLERVSRMLEDIQTIRGSVSAPAGIFDTIGDNIETDPLPDHNLPIEIPNSGRSGG